MAAPSQVPSGRLGAWRSRPRGQGALGVPRPGADARDCLYHRVCDSDGDDPLSMDAEPFSSLPPAFDARDLGALEQTPAPAP